MLSSVPHHTGISFVEFCQGVCKKKYLEAPLQDRMDKYGHLLDGFMI